MSQAEGPVEVPLSCSSEMLDMLSEFSISKNGFLPADSPLENLSDDYYQPWEVIAHNLPRLAKNGIREAVRQLPLLTTDRLVSDSEWRRAYVILAFMTNAYIWAEEKPEEVRKQPNFPKGSPEG